MGKFAKMAGDPRIGYIFNQCRKMGLWEPLEKSEAKMSFTLNGRMLYFKNSKQYKLFRVLFDKVKKSGMDIDEFLDSMPNVVKINENKNILNMKKVIRLTENDLRGIIKSSVSKILREGAFDYVPSASDYEGIADDNFDLDNYDGFYDYDNLGDYEPEMDDYGIDPSIMTDIDPDNLSDEDLSVDFNESSRRLGRIIRESVNNVLKKKALNEGIKGVDPYNVVPQSVAEKYGFKREYSGFENGLELWGKSIVKRNTFRKSNKWGDKTDMSTRELLRALGISNFTTFTETPYGLKVRITVEPDKATENEWGWGKRRRKIGDYEDTEWRDKGGAIFHNPKNGHFKRF